MAQSQQPLNILELLDNVAFPATVIELVRVAENNDASEEALDQIRAMPDREYTSIHDVAMHMGEVEELPGQENLWPSAESDDLPPVAGNASQIGGSAELGTAMRIVEGR